MSVNPKRTIDKLERLLTAWNTLKPEKTFGGMNKEQFEAYVASSRAARATLQGLENQIKEVSAFRDECDEIALEKARLVKNAVIADPECGENSAFYEAMGYIRRDDKKSGLTRKKNPVSPQS